jgi:hypothetical protein
LARSRERTAPSTPMKAPADYRTLAWGLFLFSVGFAFGARYVGRSYIRRKFRVIHALDRLIDEIGSCAGDYRKLSLELLRVAEAMRSIKGRTQRVSGPLMIHCVVIVLVVR